MRAIIVAMLMAIPVPGSAEEPRSDAAREAALQLQCRNNLKQIGLAFHEYHDHFGHFPPAVVMGPDGETMHSWRVELLPLLVHRKELLAIPIRWEMLSLDGRRRIYNSFIEADGYRLVERWDSDANQQFQSKIPDVFRHPRDAPDSTNTGFVALTGAESAFSETRHPLGTPLERITDQPGKTLLVAEAKCGIPWIATDDLEYDRERPFPKLGGFRPPERMILTCDGAVHSLSPNVLEADLRALTTMAARDEFTIPGIPWVPQT